MNAEELGREIRERRNHLGMTLRQVARLTDRSASYLSDLELGRRNPSLETIIALSECLGVPSAPWLDLAQKTSGEEIRALRAEVERLQEGLRAILREHRRITETVGRQPQCCTCNPQDKRWPCVTVLEARAALGGEE